MDLEGALQKIAAFEQDGKVEDLDAAIAGLSALPVQFETLRALSRAYQLRFWARGAVADAVDSAKTARQAIKGQKDVPTEAVRAYALALKLLYETIGDADALQTAVALYETVMRESRSQPLTDAVKTGLADVLLHRYQRTGNSNDLDEVLNLTATVAPLPLAVYVHACGLREVHRRSGSLQQLEIALNELSRLDLALRFATAYGEALIDYYRVFPDRDTLLLVKKLIGDASSPSVLAVPDGAECAMALGYAGLLYVASAEQVEETSEGVPIVWMPRNAVETAQTTVDLLRKAAGAFADGAPRLPLCMARLSEALVVLARLSRESHWDEAVELSRRAALLLPRGAVDSAAVYRSLYSALRWAGQARGVAMERPLVETSVLRGDLLAGLECAVEWSTWACEESRWAECVRACVQVESILDALFEQLKVEGRFNMDLLEERTTLVGSGYTVDETSLKIWLKFTDEGPEKITHWVAPAWMKLAAGSEMRAAEAWAQIGKWEEAILALERQRMVVLDCGCAGMSRPGWEQILQAAEERTLVYLVTGKAGGYALIVDAAETPCVKSIPLPDLSAEMVATLLRGPATDVSDMVGLKQRLGIFAPTRWKAKEPSEIHLIATEASGGNLWLQSLDECGKWLGEKLLAPLEAALLGKHVVLISAGQAALLPFESAWLPDASHPTGRRYLIDCCTIQHAPSARILVRKRSTPAEDRFFGMSGPQELRYATAEIDLASSMFREKQIVQGTEAVRMAVVNAAGTATVMHICCHAYSNFNHPADSALLLAGGDRLSLRDLVRLDFSSARLVILSACESGRISRRAPSQMASLASGLLGAGAQAVIATEWRIEDPATSTLMLCFYHAWRHENQSPAAALQKAQQWLRDTTNDEKVRFCESLLPDLAGAAVFDTGAVSSIYHWLAFKDPDERSYSHPYYWAAFRYNGQ